MLRKTELKRKFMPETRAQTKAGNKTVFLVESSLSVSN